MTALEPRNGWQAEPHFAPLDGERPVARSRIPRMPTLGALTVARLVRRMKMRLKARSLARARQTPAGEDGSA